MLGNASQAMPCLLEHHGQNHAAERSANAGTHLTPLSLTLGSLFSLPFSMTLAQAGEPASNALPTGGQVVGGAASIQQNANALSIQQTTDRAAINWQNFNIGSQASVQFNQPSTSSVVLNRVLGNEPSQIFGRLSSNGYVYLVNPSGVMFAPGSRVDVGGLVASTLSLATEDFMGGKNVFSRNGSNGSVVNEGVINANAGGLVALLGSNVRNSGEIHAQLGTVALAGGDKVTLSAPQPGADANSTAGRWQIAVEGATVDTLIENKQLIRADGGQVIMTSRAASALTSAVVQSDGTIEAHSFREHEGRIVLDAGTTNGTATSSGTLDVSASASDTQAQGGAVIMSGTRVGLFDHAVINASGAGGGGRVILGGDQLHKASDVMNVPVAQQTYISSGATIDISSSQGNGGFVETSGQSLQMYGNVLGHAGAGKQGGQWLIDPNDITISTANASMNSTTATPTGASYVWQGNNTATSTVSNSTLSSALTGGTSIEIRTNATAGSGNITVANAVTAAGAANLTLNASGNININAAVALTNTTAGSLTLIGKNISSVAAGTINISKGLTLNASSTGGVLAGVVSGTGGVTKNSGGTVTLTGANTYSGTTTVSNGTLQVGNGTSGSLGTGSISVTNAVLAFNLSGSSTHGGASGSTVTLNNATVNVLGGNITLRGSSSGGTAISLQGNLTLNNSGSGLTLFGNATNGSSRGILFAAGTVVNTSGNVTLQANHSVSGGSSRAMLFNGNTSFNARNGNLTLNAISTASDEAFRVDGSNTWINTSGNVSVSAYSSYGGGFTNQNRFASDSGTLTLNATNSGYKFAENNLCLSTTSSGNIVLVGPASISTGITALGSGNIAVNSVISGGASVTQNSTGITTLIANNTYTGTTTINNGTLVFNNSGNQTLSGAVNGAGNLTQAGSGITTLTGNGNFSGNTLISAGTLQVGNGGTSGSLGTGNVTNNANLSFNRSDALLVRNNINGTGNVSLVSGGGAQLAGTVNIGGALSVNSTGSFYTNANNITAGSFLKSGAGASYLNGGNIRATAGDINFTSNVVLAADADMNASNNVTFGGTVESGAMVFTDVGDWVYTATGSNVRYLVVGGGGGGGSSTGGGGGAGGLLQGTTYAVTAGTTYNVSVGAGGAANSNGVNSTFATLTAVGGGAGQNGGGSGVGAVGGSGGGGGYGDTSGGAGTTGQGTTGGGGRAGTGATNDPYGTGGGGGAGAPGGTANAIQSGNGGAGLYNNITGSNVAYAGGGGGGADSYRLANSQGMGGVGGGGNGGSGGPGSNGVSGTGGGGGGGANTGNGAGGTGGSGVVALRNSAQANLSITGANVRFNGNVSGNANNSLNTLTINNANVSGAGVIKAGNVVANQTSGSATWSNVIAGAANFSKQGAGSTVLTANNSFSGDINIAAGTLQIGNGSAGALLGGGNYAGAIRNDGTLLFNTASNQSLSGVISGNGKLTQAGSGTTTLTADNSYGGGTDVTNGLLLVGNGSMSGSVGSGNVSVMGAGEALFQLQRQQDGGQQHQR